MLIPVSPSFSRPLHLLLAGAAVVSAATLSLTDTLAANANLSSLQALLTTQLPDLLTQLEAYNSTNPITFLAPSNAAFDKIVYFDILAPAWANNDTATMQNVMLYHVLPGVHTSQTLNGTFQFLPSLLTSSNFTNIRGGQRVGAVLQGSKPPELVFTSGESTRSVVTMQDISFAGGIIQVVDTFVLPPVPFVDTAEKYGLGNLPEAMTAFLGALYSDPNNLTLATLLNTTSGVTIFAPVNVALETVSVGLSSLSASAFQSLLSYHIVLSDEDPTYSYDFSNGTSLHSLQGDPLNISFAPNSYFVDSARIVTSDILIFNGVVHLIDVVLDPNVTSVQPNPTSATQAPVLPTAGTVFGVPWHSFNSSEAPFTMLAPNYVPTATPDATSTGPGVDAGVYATASSSASAAAVTQTKSSRAGGGPQPLSHKFIGLVVMPISFLFGIAYAR